MRSSILIPADTVDTARTPQAGPFSAAGPDAVAASGQSASAGASAGLWRGRST